MFASRSGIIVPAFYASKMETLWNLSKQTERVLSFVIDLPD